MPARRPSLISRRRKKAKKRSPSASKPAKPADPGITVDAAKLAGLVAGSVRSLRQLGCLVEDAYPIGKTGGIVVEIRVTRDSSADEQALDNFRCLTWKD